MEEKIIEIIENLTGYDKLKENVDIDLLENEILDSLAFIELMTTLEEEFNIEIQRADKGAGRKRARYNSSMMDANLLEKGENFEVLPETFVVFITENDVIGKGQPLYRIERCFLETGESFDDGSHILYVNGAYRDESPIGRLMHDFSCTNPSDMYYGVLADRVRFFKESKEGIAVMCKVMEDMRKDSLKEVALRMLAAGKYALEEIANISGLSLEEVKKLKEKRTV